MNAEIKTKIKKFDKDLYDKYDKAKYFAIDYFKSKKLDARVNPKRYGVDLIVSQKNTDKFYCEVEVKRPWKGPIFVFPTIQVLFKKKKHFTLDKPSMLMMFNDEMTHALLLNDKDILESPVEEIPNRYNRNEEFFYIVDIKKATFVEV